MVPVQPESDRAIQADATPSNDDPSAPPPTGASVDASEDSKAIVQANSSEGEGAPAPADAPEEPSQPDEVPIKQESEAPTASSSRRPSPEPNEAPKRVDGEDYYLETRDVDWSEVSLDQKVCSSCFAPRALAHATVCQVQALYDVIEWHMVDPERFRRHLTFEEDGGWVRAISSTPCQQQAYP